jgi:hypothetical protein
MISAKLEKTIQKEIDHAVKNALDGVLDTPLGEEKLRKAMESSLTATIPFFCYKNEKKKKDTLHLHFSPPNLDCPIDINIESLMDTEILEADEHNEGHFEFILERLEAMAKKVRKQIEKQNKQTKNHEPDTPRT